MEVLKFSEMRLKKDKVVFHLPIDKIRSNPYQPRKYFNRAALEELSESIKAYGVLQPITVRKMNGGYYELVAGERRLRASELAGKGTGIKKCINHSELLFSKGNGSFSVV